MLMISQPHELVTIVQCSRKSCLNDPGFLDAARASGCEVMDGGGGESSCMQADPTGDRASSPVAGNRPIRRCVSCHVTSLPPSSHHLSLMTLGLVSGLSARAGLAPACGAG